MEKTNVKMTHVMCNAWKKAFTLATPSFYDHVFTLVISITSNHVWAKQPHFIDLVWLSFPQWVFGPCPH